jgi:large subunit ribosomal protein L23
MGLFTRKKTDAGKKDVKDAPKQEGKKKVVAKKAVKAVVDKKQTKAVKPAKTEKLKSRSSNAYKILLKPLVTEKAAGMSSLGKYVFEVSKDANKIEVSEAVEEVYGVKPTDVNIMNFAGKKVTRGRFVGRRKDWRKAIVTLKKGETINIYEGI